MSDGITNAFRDSRIIEKIEEVRGLQKKFLDEQSIELAKEIVDKLNVIKNHRRGEFNEVNKATVERDINYYQEYINKKSASSYENG